MEMKECACCHRLLPTSSFTRNKRNKDGLHSYCKECNKEKARQYNLSKGKDYLEKYLNKQKESGYYRYGHGAFANMKKSAAKRNVDFELTEEELKEWWLNTADSCFYCDSTIEEYIKIRDFVLSYCGTNELINYIKEHVYNKQIYRRIKTMTIDRVDSFGPYSVENIVKSCWICNSLKSNKKSKEEMVDEGHKIVKVIKEEMNNGKK
ncbi:MAG: hypothetical protein J6N95_01950 [Bacilli bacterium]|nr:hypothetical protein [Bacilli bacterium]